MINSRTKTTSKHILPSLILVPLLSIVVVCMFTPTVEVKAIPPFARKYKTSCITCHAGYPRLNAVGEAFKANGYRFSGDDELVKEEPVELGDEVYKELWPKSIWPSDIPLQIPLAIRTQLMFNQNPEDAPVENDFHMPHNLYLLAAGTTGERFSYFLHAHVLSVGDNGFNTQRMYLQYNALGDGAGSSNILNIKAGMFEPSAVPFSTYTNLTLTSYALTSYGFTLDERWSTGHHGSALSLGRNQIGVEINGILFDRLSYAAGIVNGNGNNAAGETYYDNNDSKDAYIRLAYKWGGLPTSGFVPSADEEDEGEAKSEAPAAPSWPERSFKLGVFAYYGDNSQIDTDLSTVDEQDVEEYTLVGGDMTLRLNRLEVLGGIAVGRVDLHGRIPRPGYKHDYNIQMLQASYQVYPWLSPYARYEFVDRDGLVDLERVIVGATAVLRPNMRMTVEGVIDSELEDNVLVLLDWVF